MSVVEVTSNLFRNAHDGDAQPDPMVLKGRPFVAQGTVANLATDNTASMYHLVDLPADCLLSPDLFFDVENWGFAQIQIGTRTDATALVNQTKITENLVHPITEGDANFGKELWEVLGLAEDPGGMIELYAHAAADATGAGTMLIAAHYVYR